MSLRVTTAVALLATSTAVGASFVRSGEISRPQAQPIGQEIFQRDCAVCHGPGGAGTGRGPTLDGVGAAGIDLAVRSGRMPLDDPDQAARRGPVTYSPDEIAALVGYAGELVSGPPVPDVDLTDADVAAGGTVYRAECASCHQMAGQGGILTSGTDVPPLGPATPVQVVEAMRSGPNEMPVFPEETISASEATDIAAYVHELGDPEDPGGWPLGHWGPVPEGAAALVLGLIPTVLVARSLGDRRRRRES